MAHVVTYAQIAGESLLNRSRRQACLGGEGFAPRSVEQVSLEVRDGLLDRFEQTERLWFNGETSVYSIASWLKL